MNDTPLCVDLDGTLVLTDTLHDGCLALVRKGSTVLNVPLWLSRGKAHLKKRIAELSVLDVTTLPYNESLVEELRRQQGAGRDIWLATGADELVANRVAQHLGVFAGVVASDGRANLVGSNKAKALVARFGKGGFDYVGNSRSDMRVWEVARQVHVVAPSAGLKRAMQRESLQIDAIYDQPQEAGIKSWLRAIRIHQWAKNLLIFLPVVLSHRAAAFPQAALAFLAFGLVASGGYLINDVLDLQEDRRHSIKKNRPLAKGIVSLSSVLALIPVLWLMAVGICLALPPAFALFLLTYVVSSFAYSLLFKKQALLDIVMLAGLYTLRIAAGGAATNIVISQWTLTVAVFLFLSLAMVKRVSELKEFRENGTLNVPGRNYRQVDIQQLGAMGAASGYMSVLVTALYINSPEVQLLYTKPHFLWFILPAQLYWISRVWLLANRGEMNQDPIVFALKDKVTYVAVAFAVISALAAI